MLYGYALGVDKLTLTPLLLPLKPVYRLQGLNKPFNALKTFYLSMYTN